MERIGVWGDSIVWGACDYELGGWVNRLRIDIDNNHSGEPAIYNLGVGGDKVSDVLKRFDIEYEARQPEGIILAVGINDSPHDSHLQGTPLDVFKQEFNDLISKVKSKTNLLAIISLTRVDDNHPDKHGYKNATIEPYNKSVKELAGQARVPYVDVSNLITPEDLILDGLHPGASGHEKIFQAVKKAIYS